jgi:hypothetical protein
MLGVTKLCLAFNRVHGFKQQHSVATSSLVGSLIQIGVFDVSYFDVPQLLSYYIGLLMSDFTM